MLLINFLLIINFDFLLFLINIERIIFELRMRFFASLRSAQNDSYLRF